MMICAVCDYPASNLTVAMFDFCPKCKTTPFVERSPLIFTSQAITEAGVELVNPVLQVFRNDYHDARWWIRALDQGFTCGATPEQIDHARRVLTRLVTLSQNGTTRCHPFEQESETTMSNPAGKLMLEAITTELRAKTAKPAVAALVAIAADLGANKEWTDPTSFLESIAEELNKLFKPLGIPSLSDESFWRPIADELGIEYNA